MSCVHYKFKSSLDYDTLKFDGLHITLADLKKAIIQQKKLGKATDFDLQVINAQTKEGMHSTMQFAVSCTTKLEMSRYHLWLYSVLERY